MSSWTRARRMAPWSCAWCGGEAGDELGLLDHQEWCLGDGLANAQLLTEVAQREGELTQEALVAPVDAVVHADGDHRAPEVTGGRLQPPPAQH